MAVWVADYTSRIAPSALKAAGVVGVCRYVSRSVWKVIDQAEYDELIRAGLGVVLNFEDEAGGWLGGSTAGRADAEFAAATAKALGYPAGAPIPSSADLNMSASEWNLAGRGYAVAYRDRLRQLGYRPGVYGPWDVLGWCRSVGYDWFWQAGMSTAWSAGRNAAAWPGVHLRQRSRTTVAGVSVDHNDILRDDWQGADDMDLNLKQELPSTFTPDNQHRSFGDWAGDVWHKVFKDIPAAIDALGKRVDAGVPVTLSAEDRAAILAAVPTAADVAAHLDYAKLAAALAAHVKVV